MKAPISYSHNCHLSRIKRFNNRDMCQKISLNWIITLMEIPVLILSSNRQVKGVTVDTNMQFCVVLMAAILDLHDKSRILQLIFFYWIPWPSKCRICHQNHFLNLLVCKIRPIKCFGKINRDWKRRFHIRIIIIFLG